MENTSINNRIMMKLSLVSVFCVCLLFVLFALIFYFIIKNDENDLKILNRHYSTLALNQLDTTLHDMRLAIKSDEVRVRMKDIMYYTNYVDAVYVLDSNHTIDRSYFKEKGLTNNIEFFGLRDDKDEFYLDKFVYNEVPDKSFLLMALKEENVIVVSMINLDKFAKSILGNDPSTALIDQDGYLYSVLSSGKKTIYNAIKLEDDWKNDLIGVDKDLYDDKFQYYIINYEAPIKLGFYSKKYFADIFLNYEPFFFLCIFVFILLVMMFVELILYIYKFFVSPLANFRDFLIKIQKNQHSNFDFSKNHDFNFLFTNVMKLYFKLRNSENTLNLYKLEHDLLFKNSDLILLYVDAKSGQIMASSQKALEFYGYDRAMFYRKTLFDLEDTSLYNYFCSLYNKEDEDGLPITNVHKTAKGEAKFVHLDLKHAVNNCDDFCIVVVRDYTNNIKLAKSLKALNNISQVGPTIVLGFNEDLRLTAASDNIENSLKYNKQEILKGAFLSDFVQSSEQIKEIKDYFSSDLKINKTMIVKIKAQNGALIYFNATLIIDYNGKNKILYLFLYDISTLYFDISRKNSQIQKYESQLEGSLFTTWEYDIEQKFFIFSQQFFALVDKDYIKEVRPSILSHYIMSEYIPLFEAEINKAINNKTYSFELIIQANNKQNEVWLRIKGKKTIIKEETKDKEVIIGIIEDISEKVKGEARVRLLAQIFSGSKESIMVTNEKREIIEVNESFVQTTGYSKEEALGNTPMLLNSGKHDSEFFENMTKEMRKNGFWSGEIYNKRKNGEIYPSMLAISAVKNEVGNITNYIGISTDITELKNKENELEQIAFYDALTGLANKRKFIDIMDKTIAEFALKGESFSLLYMDLDGFKAANDTYGHSCGDEVLKEVSRRLNNVLSKNNLKNSVISRLGGDEFVCLLADEHVVCQMPGVDAKSNKRLDYASDSCFINTSFESSAIDVANEIINDINEKFIIGDYNVKIGVTIGITYFSSKNSVSSHELLEEADWAMYQAKLAGKNCYYEFNEKTSKIYKEYKNLLAKLEKFDTNNFTLLYAPIYDALNNNILALEVDLQLKDSKSVLTAGDLSNILSQKYWFSDLNIWIFQSALDVLRKLALLNVTLYINTPISQLNSNAFFKKFTEFAKGRDLSNVKILLNDIYTARNPASEVNELEKKYKEFGIGFVIDEIDERSSELISSVNVKDLRISRNYTKDVLKKYENIYKIQYIFNFCISENKRVSTKFADNAYSYKILSALGIECLGGDFIGKAVGAEHLKDAINEFHDKKDKLRKLATLDNIEKSAAINLYGFIIFQNDNLEKIIKMLKADNLQLFDFNAYRENFAKLRRVQDESLAWVCDMADDLIVSIYGGIGDKDENIQKAVNEKLRLLKHIIGE